MTGNETIWLMLVAALVGFLIGLERERKRERAASLFAGVRTFTLISLFGALCALLVDPIGVWPLATGFVALSILIALGYWRESRGDKIGGTTEVAALVAFLLGVLAGQGEQVGALAGAVIVTGVLSLRRELHGLAGGLTQEDLLAVVRFAAVSLIVLPLVPNESMGPWGVWNPRTIWLMVVLISGVSFVGYVAMKIAGARRGIHVSGLLGGLASSTAATVSFAERGRDTPELGSTLAVGTLAATAVAAPRLLVLLGVVGPGLIPYAAVPLGAMFVAASVTGTLIATRRPEDATAVRVSNPFELRPALQFGLLFAAVLLVLRAARETLGDPGVLLASALAGVTQLDAITLSLAEQAGGGLDPVLAGRALALAVAANSLFKGILAMAVGGGRYGRLVLPSLLLSGAAAVAAAWWLLPMLPPPT
ncbi:MAG: DUF4010 domain-containing protein [Gammaproteobacteria bacterium]|nr:DUF4010 domain-containing protein [Gammaproteobacteria bacterium]